MNITRRRRRRRRNEVIDVSGFLLLEATGDSESGCNFDPAMADHINHIEEDDDDHDHDDGDDDAESCSCSTSTAPGVRGRNIYSLEIKFGNIGGDVHDYYDDDDDDDDDGVVEQKDVNLHKKHCRDDQRINGVVAKEKKPSSSSDVSIENPKQTMNEMEKNRLFWEACLAS